MKLDQKLEPVLDNLRLPRRCFKKDFKFPSTKLEGSFYVLPYLRGLIFSNVSPTWPNGPPSPSPSLLASSLPAFNLTPVRLAPVISAIFTSPPVTLAPVTLSPCIWPPVTVPLVRFPPVI